MMVANWGEMHPQKAVVFQPLPRTWSPECGIFLDTKVNKINTFCVKNLGRCFSSL